MSNVSTTVVRLSNFPPKLHNVPPNYPLGPAPGKLQLLLNSNAHQLYHKYSPFTNYNDSILGGVLSDQQPFVYTYIDEFQNSTFNQLPESVKGLADIANVNQDSINDIVRVSKFLISSWGVQFLITQAAVQRTAPFDETRIYNPLSPILATVQPLTLGIGNLPTRHIEGGLLGLANSVTSTVGINLTNGFQTPKSTVGDGALPSLAKGQGKGLIRGGDANTALVALKQRWGATQSTGTSLGLSGLLSTIGSSFKAFFGSAPKSPGTYRADEQTADLMYNNKTLYLSKDGFDVFLSWFQPWYNGNTGKRPNTNMMKLWPIPQLVSNNIIYTQFKYQSITQKSTFAINGLTVGYTTNQKGNNYTDVIFPAKDQQFTNSDMLVNYADYIRPQESYVTKMMDSTNESVKAIQKNLQSVVDNINNKSTYKVYKTNVSYLLPYGANTNYIDYDSWIKKQKDSFSNDNTPGAGAEYGNSFGDSNVTIPKSIDVFTTKNGAGKFSNHDGSNLRMATTFISDGINLLDVLDGTKNTPNNQTFNSIYPGWSEWKPYDDDLIAFFFYDVVNDKYIPFRATVKGISEGNTAFWDELRFIGRSDQLYSYNGFSRTLSFTFNVVINSVNELLPSWKKINYIASAVKPSNYTHGQNINNSFDRFIVPPMFMLTIGDLYKFQPMVITSINVNIPDDASWETLNENNSQKGWSYLNGLITNPNLGKNYGQLPREAEIAVTCNLLEKERARVGGSHFGHAPYVDNWESQSIDNRFLIGGIDTPYLPSPTTLHQNFVLGHSEQKNTSPNNVNPPASIPTSTGIAQSNPQQIDAIKNTLGSLFGDN